MNRTLFIYLLLALMTVISMCGLYYFTTHKACAFGRCWNYVCYNGSQCGRHCSCIIPADQQVGECVTIE